MTPILSANQIRQWDATTLTSQGISSQELMERAASRLTAAIASRFPPDDRPILLACGPGNNGGDGLALARMMSSLGYRLVVMLTGERCSPDRQTNLHRLEVHPEVAIYRWPEKPDIHRPYALVIDALLGTGFKGSLEGPMAEIVSFLNGLKAFRLAVDMPTGLSANHSLLGNVWFHSGLTLTLQCPKPSLLMAENHPAFGDWEVVDIGLDPIYPSSIDCFAQLVDKEVIQGMLQTSGRFAHKGSRGHALLISGSVGMMGAARLAGEACLRSGVGKLTVHVPHRGLPVIQTALPEAMAQEDRGQDHWESAVDPDPYDAVGIGCGIGRSEATARALLQTLGKISGPVVLDADALFHLSDHPEWWGKLPAGTILTPHPGEFRKMAGTSRDGFEEIERLRTFCKEYRLTIVLKGAFSRICMPDGSLWINPTGNPGMATAGSGDVLTGMMTAFLAQGYDPGNAAILATYLHGLAGDLALDSVGAPESLIASDIVAHIAKAIRTVRGEPMTHHG